MKERIELLLQIQNMSPSQFADEIGVQRSVVSHVLSGRNNPSLEFVTKTLSRFSEIRPDWMLFGSGSMLKMPNEVTILSETPPHTEERNLFSETKNTESSIVDIAPESVVLRKPVSGAAVENKPTNTSIAISSTKELPAEDEDMPNSELRNQPQETVIRKISKIILFYSDHSFEEFTPGK